MFDEVHTDGEIIFTWVEKYFSIGKLESISSIEGKNCILIGRRNVILMRSQDLEVYSIEEKTNEETIYEKLRPLTNLTELCLPGPSFHYTVVTKGQWRIRNLLNKSFLLPSSDKKKKTIENREKLKKRRKK